MIIINSDMEGLNQLNHNHDSDNHVDENKVESHKVEEDKEANQALPEAHKISSEATSNHQK